MTLPMKPAGTKTKADTGPAAPRGPRRVLVCLLLGFALLAAGCWAGIAHPQSRVLVLGLLCAGIALFGVALVLLRRRAEPRVAALPAPVAKPPAPAPPPPLTTPSAAQPAVGLEPAPVPVPVALSTPPSAPVQAPAPTGERAFDVTTLMAAPLTDLLLAAMCKDPVEARRIFARALEIQATPTAPRPSTTAAAP